MPRPLLFAACIAAFAATPAAAQASRGFELSDLGRLVSVNSPVLSPDGRWVAAVVSRPNYADNRRDSELVLIDVASGAQRVLTAGRRNVAQPVWSPAGDRIAFLAARDTSPEARSQIHVLALAGGDARRITDAARGVQHFAWRPDGRAIAYATEDEPRKLEGEERHNDGFEVGENDMFLAAEPLPSHVWLVGADGGAPDRLTSGSWSLPATLPPGPPSSRLAWTPDGERLVFARRVRPHSGVSDSSAIHLFDIGTGAIRPLTGTLTHESMPVVSPDGRLVAYWHARDDDRANVQEVYVAPIGGGAGHSITRAIDRNIYLSRWLPDGRSLLVGANDGTGVSLWIQPVDGPATRLDLGNLTPGGSFGLDVAIGGDSGIVFAATAPDRPVEVYHMASPTATPRRLTDFNAEVAALALGRVESIRWKGADGWWQDGVLTYPPSFDSTGRYPLVLLIHGGPRSSSKTGFSAQAQLMAARGWLIFQPNYRGSDNLGNAFQRAIQEDRGRGPGRDVMSGIAELRKRPYVDASRMAVTGWSYGGYMAAWLAGSYPKEWRASVAGAPVTDWIDSYNFADASVTIGRYFDGSPWVGDNAKRYLDQSPITHAHRTRAPTLIMSNVQDFRVPVTQSYKLYRALKDNGVTTQFIAYPGRMHFPDDPVRQRDVYRRWIDWVEKHLDAPAVAGR